MIVALFPNTSKNLALSTARDICQFLSNKNVQVAADDLHAEAIGAVPLSQIDHKQINFRISLGGDGTILRLIHRHPEIDAPLLGINLGSLGFMADIPLSDIYSSLQDLLDGYYTIQNRMMMEGCTSKNDCCRAVNEMVIHRAQNPCLIDLAVYVDGIYLNTFSADGIIISTPSGSTAYSLAAGGPIVAPELDAFIITPISPHTISNRPIVLMPKRDVQVQYLSPLSPIEVSYDGISSFTMSTNEIFTVFPSKQRFYLVSFASHDYFSTLREKLNWQGKLKI